MLLTLLLLAGAPTPAPTPAPAPAPTRGEPRFVTAAAETLALELLPWALNRYVLRRDYAFISFDTVYRNFQTGFTYDRDHFKVNQTTHPYHGSFYFNAARANGYSFWESVPFTVLGSFLWECCMEREPPAINDLVNTSLGGITRGEIVYRLADLLRNAEGSGLPRFWREAGAVVLNPMDGLSRFLRGELGRSPPERAEPFPSRFVFAEDLYYRHRAGSATAGMHTDQAGVTFSVHYGDPFEGERVRPFDAFDVTLDLAHPAAVLVTHNEQRGVLGAWTLAQDGAVQQRLAVYLRFLYTNDEPLVFGAQAFSVDHLLRAPLGRDVEFRGEAGVSLVPMGAIQVDYAENGLATVGRSYDYGPGGGLQASARLRRQEVELASLSWYLLWQREADGISRNSRIQSLAGELRVPLWRHLAVGASYQWTDRLTTYDALPGVRRAATAARFFATLTLQDWDR